MADGSLKFDTKINVEGFEDGISSLKEAMVRLTRSVDQLTAQMAKSFQTAGTAVTEAGGKAETAVEQVDSIAEAEARAAKEAEELKRQMDAITVSYGEQDAPAGVEETREIPIQNPAAYGYDQGAIDFIENYAKGLGEAEKHTNEFRQEIDTLETKLKELEQQGFYFGDEEYDDTYFKLAKVKQALADYKKEMVSPTPDHESVRLRELAKNAEISSQKIVELSRKLRELQARQKELQAAGVGPGYTEYDSNARQISELSAAVNEYQRAANSGSQVNQRFTTGMSLATSWAKRLLNVVSRLGKGAVTGAGRAAKLAAKNVMGLGRAFLFGHKKAQGFGHRINGITKRIMVLSLIRGAIRGITSAFKEGTQNFAGYSAGFNTVVSSFLSSILQLKNSLAAAFSPITSDVLPVLDALAQRLITVIHLIGQFLAAITGKGTFTKAVKVNKDYAAGLKGTGGAAKQAGKDVKKSLAPFDELNELQKKGSGAGGGGGGGAGGIAPSQMFETVPIDSAIKDFADQIRAAFEAGDYAGIGKIIGEKINAGVATFTDFISWDNVGDEITLFALGFTDMFNSLVGTINWFSVGEMFGAGIDTLAHTLYLLLKNIDWMQIGQALGEGLNGLVDRVDWDTFGRMVGAYFQAKISGLYGFVTTADWPAIGLALATALSGVFSEIDWEMLGNDFAYGLSGLITAAGTFAANFDWAGFGSSLASSFSAFFKNFDWGGTGTALSDLVIGLLDALIAFLTETDWQAFGAGVGEMLVNIDWLTIADKLYEAIGAALGAVFGALAGFIGELIVSGVTGAKEYFNGKIEECGGNVGLGILKGISDALSDIRKWISDHMFKPFLDGFLKAFGISGGTSELEKYGKDLWNSFCKGVIKYFSNPGEFIKKNITDPFLNGIKSFLGIHSPSTVLEEIGDHTVAGFNQGVEKSQNSSKKTVQSWASGVAEWFASKLGISSGDSEEAEKWAAGTISGYNNTVGRDYTKSKQIMEQWAEGIRKWFVGDGTNKGVNEASWKKFAETIIQALKSGIESGSGNTRAPLESWGKNCREWFWGDSNTGGTGGLYKAFYDMGKRINEGFAKGIGDFAGLAKRAVKDWGQDVIREAKTELDIHSPSKEAYSIAEYFVQGFNDGMADMINTSVSTIRKWLDGVTGVFNGVTLDLPVGVRIPNASSYLPKIASGTVAPPRAGEYEPSRRHTFSDSDDETGNAIVQLLESLSKKVEGLGEDIHLNISLDENTIYRGVVTRNQLGTNKAGLNPLTT